MIERDSTPQASFWRAYDLALLDRLLPAAAGTLLDIGCGLGHYSAAIAGRFKDVILVDACEGAIECARERITRSSPHVPVTSYCGDVLDLDLPSGSVSVALATGAALCYQQSTLQTMILRAGGFLCRRGILFGDVWNTTSPILCSAYPLVQDKSGSLWERIGPAGTPVYPTDARHLESLLRSAFSGNRTIRGRKALYLLGGTFADLLVRWVPALAARTETQLARIRSVVPRSPKLVFWTYA